MPRKLRETCKRPLIRLLPESAPSRLWAEAKKPVLLTFDDGPCEAVTRRILDVLSDYGIKSIFFVIGERLKRPKNASLLEQIVDEGHLVGNHSYTHARLGEESSSRIRWEIEETQKLLCSFGIRERLFRPPYGSVSQNVLNLVRSLNFWGVGWNADPCDWNQAYQGDIWIREGYQRVAEHTQSIVLLHDVHTNTASGLGAFIELLISLGCSFPPLFCDCNGSEPAPGAWVPGPQGWQTIEPLRLFRPQ